MDESVVKHLEVTELLLRTAAHIERHGLSCQGSTDHLGRHCVMRAMIEESDMNYALHGRAVSLLSRALFATGDEPIPVWSDKAGRDGRADEVVAKLRAVALGL